jgi:flagellar P-ring protein precursor FlgI
MTNHVSKRAAVAGRAGRALAVAVLLILGWQLGSPARAGVRIKDITEFEGARSNQIYGLGLVVGLNGTGGKMTATQQAAVDMLQRFKVSTKILALERGDSVFKSTNISLVMITSELGPFSRRGSKIDVTVAAIDDATSLLGGQLLPTPLRGADGVDYAVAQGTVNVPGFSFGVPNGSQGPIASAQKNHPTVGRIAAGAIVEREARGRIVCDGQVRLLLREPDFLMSRRIAAVINGRYPGTAFALDPGSVQVFVPAELCTNVVCFAAEIGMLEVEPNAPARVVYNPRTGTIVAGQHVRISAAAITHGNLAVVTNNQPIASQPAPFSRGKTAVLPRAQIGVAEQESQLRVVEDTITVGDLARALNQLGASPRDLIDILEALYQAGALHAELKSL